MKDENSTTYTDIQFLKKNKNTVYIRPDILDKEENSTQLLYSSSDKNPATKLSVTHTNILPAEK